MIDPVAMRLRTVFTIVGLIVGCVAAAPLHLARSLAGEARPNPRRYNWEMAEAGASPKTSLIFFDGTNFDRRLYEAYRRTDVDHAKLFGEIATGTRLIGVHYFYAMLVQHADRDRYAAQRRAVSILRALPGVTLHEGQHRKRETRCPHCKRTYNFYAEKGTDVSLSAQLVIAACRKAAEQLIVVSADNDFAQAITLARNEGAAVNVAFLIDPNHHEHGQLLKVDALRRSAGRYAKIDQEMLYRCWETSNSA